MRSKMSLAGYKAWETKLKKQFNFKDEELEKYLEAKIIEKMEKKESKKFRDLIKYLGGINDNDYMNIPRWAKRKNGRHLDELAISVSEYGYSIEDANDLHKLILKFGGN